MGASQVTRLAPAVAWLFVAMLSGAIVHPAAQAQGAPAPKPTEGNSATGSEAASPATPSPDASRPGSDTTSSPPGDQAGEQKPSDADKERAKERFKRGLKLARDGNCEGALAEFEASYELVPRPNTLYNIARCQSELFRYDLAVRAYERYLSEVPADSDERTAVEMAMQSLRDLLGTIQVASNVEAEIWVRDRLVGTAPGSILIPGGRHALELRAEGYLPSRKEVDVAAGATAELKVELRKAERRVDVTVVEDRGIHRAVFWTGVGATLATALVGGVFAGLALKERNDGEDIDPLAAPLREDAQDNVRRFSLLADTFFGIAGAFAISTLVVGFLTDFEEKPSTKNDKQRARLSTQAHPRGGRLLLTGSF